MEKRVLNQSPKPCGTLDLQCSPRHWVDVFQNGTKPDVRRVYQNADACVDKPGNFFFEEILEAFPNCKVILSVRKEDSWIESYVR